MKFGDILRALRRGAPFALLVTAIAVVMAVLLTQRMEPVYEASASVLASRPSGSMGDVELITPPVVDARVYQKALLDGDVIHDALLRVDGRDRGVAEMVRFKEKVRVGIESHEVSSVIRIDVRDGNPELAATYANAIATQLIDWDRNRARQMVSDSIAAIERAIAEIDAQIAAAVDAEDQLSAQRLQTLSATMREGLVRELDGARARSASAVIMGLLETLNVAQAPVEPIAPRPVFNVFLAVLLGLFLGYGLQFARWSLDDRVGSTGGLAEATGLTVLGNLPVPRSGLRLSQESIGLLRASLMRALKGDGLAVIGVASAVSFTEKSGVAISLADSLARSGYRTLLIDADVRRQGPGYGIDVTRFAVPRLEAYLRDPGLKLEPLAFAIDSRRSFDALLPSGSGEPYAGPLEGSFSALTERLRGAYDVVIIDIPPVLSSADAVAAASVCNAIALCVGVNAPSGEAREAALLLQRSGAELVGAFLTGARRDGVLPRQPKMEVKPTSRAGSGSMGRAAAGSEPPPRAYARVKQR